MSDSEERTNDADNSGILSALPINESGLIDREIVHDIIGVGVAPILTRTTSEHELSEPDLDSIDASHETEEDKEKEPIDADEQSNIKTCRELKSILALSKEAKLDTNISHKRKTLDNTKGKETPTRSASSDSNEALFKRLAKIPTTENRIVRYPVTAECEIEYSIAHSEDGKEEKIPSKIKRKRDSLLEASPGGAVDEINKRSRKSFSHEIVMFKQNKDMFCWRCHRDGVGIACETCPRSYHQKCLKQTITNPDHWPCPECVSILKAESTQTRSKAMKGMTLEHLCGLLKFAVNRMIQCSGSEPFIHPVCEKEFPDYKKYIMQPMDLTLMEKNIKENLYGSTQAFEADAKWILHNSIIFNSYQSKLTTAAKGIVKICKQEMAEIENCPSCYLNANTKKNTWFVEVCPKPHLLVWAKLKGFPYWPAKAMCTNSTGMVDVRFFGAHDRAWVHYRECYLYSVKDPNSYKQKRYDIENCIKELNIYLDNLRKVYGEVRLAPFKTLYDPENVLKQLQSFLPRYNTSLKIKIYKADSGEGKEEVSEKKVDADDCHDEEDDDRTSSKIDEVDTTMEGYGTDEDSKSEIDSEQRKMLRANVEELEGDRMEEDAEEVVDSQFSNHGDKKLLRGIVRTRGGFNNFAGKLKIIPRQISENYRKSRQSADYSSESPLKLSRRNSDQSIKSDSSRVSNISEKISRVDVAESVETSLGIDGSENVSSTSSESSKSDMDQIIDGKRKAVQVEVEHAELSISPQSKLKITDKLMKRLSDGDEGLTNHSENVESIKRTLRIESSLDCNDSAGTWAVRDKKVKEKVSEDITVDSSVSEQKDEVASLKEKEHGEVPIDENSNESFDDAKSNKTDVEMPDCVSVEPFHIDKATEKEKSIQNVEKLKVLERNIETNSKKLSDETNKELCGESGDEQKIVQLKEINSEKQAEKVAEPSKSVEELCKSVDEPVVTDKVVGEDVEMDEEKNRKKTDVMNIIEEFDADSEEAEESMDTGPINEADIRNIIHSSLNEGNVKLYKVSEAKENINTDNSASNSNKKRKINEDGRNENEPKLKIVKIINIDKIIDKSLISENVKNSGDETDTSSVPSNESQITKKKSLVVEQKKSTDEENFAQDASTPVEIKSEPDSDRDVSDTEYMEAKRKYLSALNISEKQKQTTKSKLNEIRTRSKTEEKKEKFKIVDNLTKVIDDVALNYSANNQGKVTTLRRIEKKKTYLASTPVQVTVTTPTQTSTVASTHRDDMGEIFVKSFAKMQVPKQRARKTFPTPQYDKSPNITSAATTNGSIARKEILPKMPVIEKQPVRLTTATTLTSKSTMPALEPLRSGSSLVILTQSQAQDVVLLPPNQTITYNTTIASPLFTVVPPLISTSTAGGNQTLLQQTLKKMPPIQPNVTFSQNYIPQNEVGHHAEQPATNSLLDSLLQNPPASQSVPTSECPNQSQNSTDTAATPAEPAITTQDTTDATAASDDGEFSVLHSLVPENVSKAVSDLLCRPPPKLRPRPPGPLSNMYDEGVPSSAGSVTAKINSVAHRLGDYFRGMLIETLEDLGKTNSPEATVSKLRMELEGLKHKHETEVAELRKNVCTILKDIQKSIVDERERIIDETRTACEAETIKRVEEAKSKQWCANCSKEAQFYCCWNTSYCDYPCQQKHWSKHMNKCTQNLNQSTPAGLRPHGQQLVLRPANPPPNKQAYGRIYAKPAKVYMNRASGASKGISAFKTSSGNHLTLVEATPGNFELVGNGPIAVSGKILASNSIINKIKSGNVTVTSPSTASVKQKTVVTPSKSPAPSVSSRTSTAAVTTISDEDSD